MAIAHDVCCWRIQAHERAVLISKLICPQQHFLSNSNAHFVHQTFLLIRTVWKQRVKKQVSQTSEVIKSGREFNTCKINLTQICQELKHVYPQTFLSKIPSLYLVAGILQDRSKGPFSTMHKDSVFVIQGHHSLMQVQKTLTTDKGVLLTLACI